MDLGHSGQAPLAQEKLPVLEANFAAGKSLCTEIGSCDQSPAGVYQRKYFMKNKLVSSVAIVNALALNSNVAIGDAKVNLRLGVLLILVTDVIKAEDGETFTDLALKAKNTKHAKLQQ